MILCYLVKNCFFTFPIIISNLFRIIYGESGEIQINIFPLWTFKTALKEYPIAMQQQLYHKSSVHIFGHFLGLSSCSFNLFAQIFAIE